MYITYNYIRDIVRVIPLDNINQLLHIYYYDYNIITVNISYNVKYINCLIYYKT